MPLTKLSLVGLLNKTNVFWYHSSSFPPPEFPTTRHSPAYHQEPMQSRFSMLALMGSSAQSPEQVFPSPHSKARMHSQDLSVSIFPSGVRSQSFTVRISAPRLTCIDRSNRRMALSAISIREPPLFSNESVHATR